MEEIARKARNYHTDRMRMAEDARELGGSGKSKKEKKVKDKKKEARKGCVVLIAALATGVVGLVYGASRALAAEEQGGSTKSSVVETHEVPPPPRSGVLFVPRQGPQTPPVNRRDSSR